MFSFPVRRLVRRMTLRKVTNLLVAGESPWVAPGEIRLYRLPKTLLLFLILGGAAVHRCDNCIVLNTALAAAGTSSRTETTTPQAHPRRYIFTESRASADCPCSIDLPAASAQRAMLRQWMVRQRG